MHKNWHNLPFMANDLISPSCQITTQNTARKNSKTYVQKLAHMPNNYTQNTRTSFAQKKGSYTRVFTLLRLLLAGVQVFLSFTLYLLEKQITVLNVQFLYLLSTQFPGF